MTAQPPAPSRTRSTIAQAAKALPAGHTGSRIFGLDLIRAIAISLVLVAHTLPIRPWFGVPLDVVSRFRDVCGMLGVELFFVLSGFLIGGILLRAIQSKRFESGSDLLAFWHRRWWRTLPLFLLFLGIHFLLNWRANGHLLDGWWQFLLFSQSFAWPHPQFFRAAWSLAVEEWFYLLFPLALFAMRKVWANERRAFLLSACAFLLGPTLLRLTLLVPGDGEWEKVTILRLDAILFGVLLVYLTREFPRRWQRVRETWPLGLIGIIAVATYLSFSAPSDAKEWITRSCLFSFISCCMCLVVGAASSIPGAHRWLSTPVSALSRWSYSLYLCHGIINAHAKGLFKVLGIPVGADSMLRMAMVWICSIGVAALLYRFFEQPLMNRRKPDRTEKEHTNHGQTENQPLALAA